jgi:adenine deaminase
MAIDPALDRLILQLPKTELHVHIEGTLEPEAMFAMAARNGVTLPWSTLDEVRAAYQFTDLQSFLDVYYLGAAALVTTGLRRPDVGVSRTGRCRWGAPRRDLLRPADPHPPRHRIRRVHAGFEAAMLRAEEQLGITSALIMCFVRHLPPSDAMETTRRRRTTSDR